MAQAGEIAERVAEAIAGRGGLLAVMSFDEPTVARLCRLVTDRPVGLLAIADNQVEEDIAAKATAARALGCDYVGPHHSVLDAMEAAAGGLPMVCWTVRTAQELAACTEIRRCADFRRVSVQTSQSPPEHRYSLTKPAIFGMRPGKVQSGRRFRRPASNSRCRSPSSIGGRRSRRVERDGEPVGERYDPFLDWDFLEAAESSGCAQPRRRAGAPRHMLARDRRWATWSAQPRSI